MEDHNLPSLSTVLETDSSGQFSIEPLFPGYGSTLGNALRRVLLSSLEGAAVDYVAIDGVQHEFSTVPHVKEDVVQILLNLKRLRFNLNADEAEMVLDLEGPGIATAGNFAPNADCQIINTNQMIATLDKGAHLVIRIGVKRGVGYEPVEKKVERNKAVGIITTDSIFSPVKSVAYHVENTRVGQMTNFDKLILEVETDGSILPSDAIKQASAILSEHYRAISGSFAREQEEITQAADHPQQTEELIVTEDAVEILHKFDPKTRIEDAGFSGRTSHALTAAGYKTLAGLKRLSDIKLQGIKGLGAKGVEEVKVILSRVE
jgi:DNA-directed RNA polymerase subunit alpha